MINNRKKYHSLSKEAVEEELKSSKHGLSEQEVHKRQKLYGKNLVEEEKVSLLKMFFKQCTSPLVYILIFASCISLFLNEIADFFIIIALVAANTLIGFWQEYKAYTSLEALKKLTETKNMVVRDKKVKILQSRELVPGDCVIFHPGEVVTADMRLLEATGLMTNEAIITGESLPVLKDADKTLPENAPPYAWANILLAGSTVTHGSGRAIVVRTGKETYLSSIGERAKEEAPETPLQKALYVFTRRYISIVLLILAILSILGYFQGHSLTDLLYLFLAMIVSAVPEGLPIVVTLVMVLGANLLRKKQTLVRDLPSVETLGSTTVIATDKTGTITEGKLIVKDTFTKDSPTLQMIASLCNDAHEGVGDPLDVALLDWVEESSKIRASCLRTWLLPFDSSLMLMATINMVNGKERLFVKGAYETLREKAMNQNISEFDDAFQSLLKKGYRVLAFSEGEHPSKDPSLWKLTLIGLIAFIDPPKEHVKNAVLMAQRAGIHVIMITGDHPITARSIAHEVGICKKIDQVLTGEEIEDLPDDVLQHKLKTTTVLARILPEDKYKVVKLLQAQGEVVAVTGDGVNDIPALKAANIGIVMGSGQEAAKSVSQMILTDNNFSVIVDAIQNARVIASNIRKVIYYLVSTSLVEITLISLSILMNFPIPLSAIQILWINLVTDGVMDKTFPFIKEEGNVMSEKPKKMEKAFFDKDQMKKISFFVIALGPFCFGLYVFLLSRYSFSLASTITFTSLITAQWANALQAQKEDEPFFYNVRRSFTINKIAFYAVPLGLLLQTSAIYLFPNLLHIEPLSLKQWVFPLGSFCFAFLVVEVRKWWNIAFK